MVNKYTITVINQSGAQQHYALFNKTPIVTGKVQGSIWANVFAVANTPDSQTGHFAMYTQYYAICGSSQGSPADGVEVDVSGEREVTLGSTTATGTTVPGTSIALEISEGAPQFSHKQLPDSGYVNAFAIQSGTDFTVKEATGSNYIVGLGGSKTGKSNDGPSATFIPEPNVTYQIQPVNTYYLTFGDYTKGAIIDVNKIGSQAVVDYTVLQADVVIIHDAYGRLNIQNQ